MEYQIQDALGNVQLIRTKAIWVPQSNVRLFSPQAYFQEHDDQGKLIVTGRSVTLELPNGSTLHFPHNRGNNLPMMLTDEMVNANMAGLEFHDAVALSNTTLVNSFLGVTHQANQNLSVTQKALLLWHQKLGHIGFKWVQSLFSVSRDTGQSILISNVPKLSSCQAPLCTACQLSKQTRRSPEKPARPSPPEMQLKIDHLTPGDCVSVDQYISGLPGRLPHTAGKEDKSKRYNGGTIFVDHASGYAFLRHQIALTAGDV